jgi:hypothetical protein
MYLPLFLLLLFLVFSLEDSDEVNLDFSTNMSFSFLVECKCSGPSYIGENSLCLNVVKVN